MKSFRLASVTVLACVITFGQVAVTEAGCGFSNRAARRVAKRGCGTVAVAAPVQACGAAGYSYSHSQTQFQSFGPATTPQAFPPVPTKAYPLPQ